MFLPLPNALLFNSLCGLLREQEFTPLGECLEVETWGTVGLQWSPLMGYSSFGKREGDQRRDTDTLSVSCLVGPRLSLQASPGLRPLPGVLP